ncbi:hypothetical protein AAFF_G00060600 [Aldrovandia affinis]|uniref:Uncharacterized protein n=1 Tax=Aldrovandia affinis TaxID=143900 RepID=A0AAD7S099_9TELE|nr:hypothetical protein AAFF_G00060600 [Aldrovandia affinis]
MHGDARVRSGGIKARSCLSVRLAARIPSRQHGKDVGPRVGQLDLSPRRMTSCDGVAHRLHWSPLQRDTVEHATDKWPDEITQIEVCYSDTMLSLPEFITTPAL